MAVGDSYKQEKISRRSVFRNDVIQSLKNERSFGGKLDLNVEQFSKKTQEVVKKFDAQRPVQQNRGVKLETSRDNFSFKGGKENKPNIDVQKEAVKQREQVVQSVRRVVAKEGQQRNVLRKQGKKLEKEVAKV